MYFTFDRPCRIFINKKFLKRFILELKNAFIFFILSKFLVANYKFSKKKRALIKINAFFNYKNESFGKPVVNKNPTRTVKSKIQ